MELCVGRVQTLNRIQTCRRTLSLGISKCKCDRVGPTHQHAQLQITLALNAATGVSQTNQVLTQYGPRAGAHSPFATGGRITFMTYGRQ